MRIIEGVLMNAQEAATVESLASRVELRAVVRDTLSEDLVFEGDDADGPVVGYISPEGKLSWVVGG